MGSVHVNGTFNDNFEIKKIIAHDEVKVYEANVRNIENYGNIYLNDSTAENIINSKVYNVFGTSFNNNMNSFSGGMCHDESYTFVIIDGRHYNSVDDIPILQKRRILQYPEGKKAMINNLIVTTYN